MIATWLMGELFATTTPLAKRELLPMPGHRKNNQELVNFA
jgi:hypothetical protein